VTALVTYFEPQPPREALPVRFASPFAQTVLHPLARAAAASLPGVPLGEGKMFGVLVVADRDGRIGFLRAFSGMLDGRWDVPGFVPPVFDVPARDVFWPAGEAELAVIAAQLAGVVATSAPVEQALAALVSRHEQERAELRDRHLVNRDARRVARAQPGAALHAIDQASRADTAELRRMRARHAGERDAIEPARRALVAEQARLETQRAERSRELLVQIQDTYRFANARRAHRTMREIFAPDEPPGGAGDCAAPKLLAYAYREGLQPLALAERWHGPPPPTGGRHDGVFYPACRGKCGPILGHMLDGLDAEPAPAFGLDSIAADEPRCVFEDDWLVVVAKPCGLLSVPGRGALRDSVLLRLRDRYQAPELAVVHRLDLDTSGLMVAAKDPETRAALQEQFERRTVEKRYAAWVDGEVAGDGGVIELALRVDLDDRPRQIYDPIHGKPAITAWQVLARDGSRTRLALYPRTGRTHQLRVHAAHPRGLAAPIAGDRLYGRNASGERLLLHAEALAFDHPRTGHRVALEWPAPF
jgi:tRNA pseudouridine32 synthase/23S rRNA pseudouridine746 synthase